MKKLISVLLALLIAALYTVALAAPGDAVVARRDEANYENGFTDYIRGSDVSGDTLFAGTCGRTDLPGGSWAQMQHSMQTLAALDGDLEVLPGHGEGSTLQSEREFNPYLRGGDV